MTDTIDVEAIKVIDTDTHISEPHDLWTSRLPQKYQDRAPRVLFNEASGHEQWKIGDYWLMGSGFYAVAGWKNFPPDVPVDLYGEGVDQGAWNPQERLRR